jgi:hypothetical protein
VSVAVGSEVEVSVVAAVVEVVMSVADSLFELLPTVGSSDVVGSVVGVEGVEAEVVGAVGSVVPLEVWPEVAEVPPSSPQAVSARTRRATEREVKVCGVMPPG